MSLDNPNIVERFLNAIKAFRHWRILGALLGTLAIIGLVLFAAESCGDWSFQRKQDKIKANINTALANIAEREKAIANLKEQQAVEAQEVNRATSEWMDAQNYTDQTRKEVNKALANLANAGKSNANISVEELKEKLRGSCR